MFQIAMPVAVEVPTFKIEAIRSELREVLTYDGEPTYAANVVRPGDIVFTQNTKYAHTATLTEQVTRNGKPVADMKAGTVLYRRAGMPMLWCTANTQNEKCLEKNNDGWNLREAYTPLMPKNGGTVSGNWELGYEVSFPADAPEIDESQAPYVPHKAVIIKLQNFDHGVNLTGYSFSEDVCSKSCKIEIRGLDGKGVALLCDLTSKMCNSTPLGTD